jgi:hypothetical protein
VGVGLLVVFLLVAFVFVVRVALFRRARIAARGRAIGGRFAPVRRIARRRRFWR